MPFLLYLILKKGVVGGRMCNLYGAGELLISRTFYVWVFITSKPPNITELGLAENMPFEPTVSYTSNLKE